MARTLLAVVLLSLAACGSTGGGNDGGTTYTVTVAPSGNMVFDPATVNIHVGDTVKWVWAGSGHTVTSGDSSACTHDNRFCSPSDSACGTPATSNSGATYSHTFTAAGTFPYFCYPHCLVGMKGTVVVSP